MSKLDEELEQAVAASEAAAAEAPGPPVAAPVPVEPRPRRGAVGLVVALLVMAAGIAGLVLWGFEGAAVYSRDVDQLVAEYAQIQRELAGTTTARSVDELAKKKQRLLERKLRVQGSLVKGSLRRRDKPCEYRFRIARSKSELDVRYAQCVVPDTFRDRPDMDVDVTAEGKLTDGGWFEATLIIPKCPSKYEMQQRAGKGEKAPHSMDALPAGVGG
jgi:cytochrome c-type biogenesis protein CcmE